MTPCITDCLLKTVVAHSRELQRQPDYDADTELEAWFADQEKFIAQGDEFNYDGPLSWAIA